MGDGTCKYTPEDVPLAPTPPRITPGGYDINVGSSLWYFVGVMPEKELSAISQKINSASHFFPLFI